MNISNTKILGHEHIEHSISNIMLSKNIFPVWIFYGPDGIGKFSLAMHFAKLLLSENELTISEMIAAEVDNRIHPDFFILDEQETQVSIDDVRLLCDKIKKKPVKSSKKIVIIRNFHRFNKNIYNSLLKILEEPPYNTIIILISNIVGNIPMTLLSRTLQYEFKPLSTELVAKILCAQGIYDYQNASKYSGGSVGMALKLHNSNYQEIVHILLTVFEQPLTFKKFIEYYVNEKVDFNIASRIIIFYLFEYAKLISGNCTLLSDKEVDTFNRLRKLQHTSTNNILRRILLINNLINKTELYSLDKTAVIFSCFEIFFDQ